MGSGDETYYNLHIAQSVATQVLIYYLEKPRGHHGVCYLFRFVYVGLSSINSVYTRYLQPIPRLWINFVSASIKGQPLYKGQKARSQCVRYLEVPL